MTTHFYEDLGDEFSGNGQDGSPPTSAMANRFRWEPITAAELAAGDFRPEYLIQGLLVAKQPAFCVGGSKTLKTTIGLDAAISIATASKFLNTFEVRHARRVAFLSGESGKFTIQETAKRICAARGIDLASISDQLFFQFRLPQLALVDEVEELRQGLERHGIGVLFLDPLYLSLLSGSQGIDAANMYQMGPLLGRITDACLAAGATPIFLHHTNRPGAKKHEPLELSDIAYSGVPEFARQWWLLSRREGYEPGSGVHQLFFSVGGSVGHGGLWHLDIDEGKLADDFTGRKWEVTAMAATNAKKAAESMKQKTDLFDELEVAGIIDRMAKDEPPRPATKTRIRESSRIGERRTDRALARLLDQKLFREVRTRVEGNNGAKQPATVFERARDG